MKSHCGVCRTLAIADTSVVLMIAALVSQLVLPSAYSFTGAISNSGGINQSSERTPNAGTGFIVGVVVNERHEPVARAIVQVFSPGVTLPRAQAGETVPPLMRASGSASTDAEGGFRISGLALGEYLVAAAPTPLFPSGGPASAEIYATTFYPSIIDVQQAVRVPAFDYARSTIQIELVRVRGANRTAVGTNLSRTRNNLSL